MATLDRKPTLRKGSNDWPKGIDFLGLFVFFARKMKQKLFEKKKGRPWMASRIKIRMYRETKWLPLVSEIRVSCILNENVFYNLSTTRQNRLALYLMRGLLRSSI